MDKRICNIKKHKTPSQLRRDARKNEKFFERKFAMTAIELGSLTRTITQTVDVEMSTAGTPEPGGRKPENFSRRFSSTMFSEEDKERLRKGPRDWWADFQAGIHTKMASGNTILQRAKLTTNGGLTGKGAS
jgi:hypothetical protein